MAMNWRDDFSVAFDIEGGSGVVSCVSFSRSFTCLKKNAAMNFFKSKVMFFNE